MKRLLIIGCGDMAMRTIPLLVRRYRVFALVRKTTYCTALRSLGAMPLQGDLDDRASLARISGLADTVLHFAPPQNSGSLDMRTRNLLSALSQSRFVIKRDSGLPSSWYISAPAAYMEIVTAIS